MQVFGSALGKSCYLLIWVMSRFEGRNPGVLFWTKLWDTWWAIQVEISRRNQIGKIKFPNRNMKYDNLEFREEKGGRCRKSDSCSLIYHLFLKALRVTITCQDMFFPWKWLSFGLSIWLKSPIQLQFQPQTLEDNNWMSKPMWFEYPWTSAST